MLLSANANNGANAGLSYANTNNVPANANANIGAQLCFVNIIFQKQSGPWLLPKNKVVKGCW